jgi:methionine synthase II (cobalamin-independent)
VTTSHLKWRPAQAETLRPRLADEGGELALATSLMRASTAPAQYASAASESKSNFIEHPELIANRIGAYANLVGRENVIAGSDCGYGTWVGQAAVDPDIVWAKLSALAEGARIASKRFWT